MTDSLTDAAARLAAARTELQDALEVAKAAARAAILAGQSEAQTARAVGLDRMTIRKAMGK